MKRSEVNANIRWAEGFLAANNIRLPEMAYWTPEEWDRNAGITGVVRKVMLGWDITDFGTGTSHASARCSTPSATDFSTTRPLASRTARSTSS